MLIGATVYPDPNDALPLTFTIEFYPDGEYGGLNSVTDCEGNEYGTEQATGIFYALSVAIREQIESECWADAEPECDDSASRQREGAVRLAFLGGIVEIHGESPQVTTRTSCDACGGVRGVRLVTVGEPGDLDNQQLCRDCRGETEEIRDERGGDDVYEGTE